MVKAMYGDGCFHPLQAATGMLTLKMLQLQHLKRVFLLIKSIFMLLELTVLHSMGNFIGHFLQKFTIDETMKKVILNSIPPFFSLEHFGITRALRYVVKQQAPLIIQSGMAGKGSPEQRSCSWQAVLMVPLKRSGSAPLSSSAAVPSVQYW